jgi:ABC-type transport system involved in multi-copper enzyme maturation permease subunit
MKYLAMLKDSLREAIDTKVFYVMVALSSVLILVFSSVSFRPLSATELSEIYTILPLNVDPSTFEKSLARGIPPAQRSTGLYSQAKVETVDGAPDSPDSPLVFSIRAHFANKGDAAKVEAAPQATKEFLKQNFASLGDWKVFEVTRVELAKSGNQNVVAFEVYTRPTRSTLRIWPHEPGLLFGYWTFSGLSWPISSLGYQLWMIEDRLVDGLGAWIAIMVSIIITAFFVPNMLRKGTIDLLLVKPIHRTTLLVYKFVGGLAFIFLNTSFVVLGIWLVLGLRSGVWATGFLWSIPILTFFFAILYSISTLFSVLTESPIVAILATGLAWVVFSVTGWAYQLPEALRIQYEAQHTPAEQRVINPDGAWVDVVKAAHFVMPRVKDIDYLTSQLLIKDLLVANPTGTQNSGEKTKESFSWQESLMVDGLFTALMLGLACLRFATKDY